MLCDRSWSFLLLQNALKQPFGVRLTNTFSQHFTIPLKIANPYSLLREKPFPQGFLQKELAIDLFDIYLKRFLREKFTDKLVYGQVLVFPEGQLLYGCFPEGSFPGCTTCPRPDILPSTCFNTSCHF